MSTCNFYIKINSFIKNKVYIFSHVPKTGGTTLETQLSEQLIYGDNFFHFYPRSRREVSPLLNKQFEIANKDLDFSYPLLLFGHNISEGTISLFPNHDIGLQTTLREPMKRMISHYNMVKSVGNFKGYSNDFIRSRGNFICRWFLEKFPSLTEDAFAPLYTQALDILDHFEDILILEKSNEEFTYFMKKMNCQFNHLRRTNIKPYGKQKVIHEDENILNSYISEDILLYNRLLKKDRISRSYKPIPQIRKPHLWYRRFIMAYKNAQIDIRKIIQETVEGHYLHNLIMTLDNKCNITPQVLFDWINKLNINKLSSSEVFNIIDVCDHMIKSKDRKASIAESDTKNTIALILKKASEHDTKMSNFGHPAWEELSDDVTYKFKGLGNYFSKEGNIEKQINNLERALTTFKTDIFILSELGKAYSITNDKDKAYLCAKKIKELKGNHPWADSYLNNL